MENGRRDESREARERWLPDEWDEEAAEGAPGASELRELLLDREAATERFRRLKRRLLERT